MNIKYFAGKLIMNIGGFALIRYVFRSKPKVLMYHRFNKSTQFAKVGRQEFEQQLKLLLKHHTIVPLSILVDSKLYGNKLVENAVAITVDDGYEDFYLYAYPLLKKYSCSATLFVTTGFVDGLCWLWPDVLDYALRNCQSGHYEVAIPKEKENVHIDVDIQVPDKDWKKLVNISLSLQEEDKKIFLKDVLHNLNIVLPDSIPSNYKPCTWNQLREMTMHGIEIGCHTVSHPSMGRVTGEAIIYELVESKKRLEQELDRPIDIFCYPNGMPDDYSKEVMSEVKRTGYRAAFVAYSDEIDGVDGYEIRRFGVGSEMYHFQKAVNGVLLLSAKFKKIFAV